MPESRSRPRTRWQAQKKRHALITLQIKTHAICCKSIFSGMFQNFRKRSYFCIRYETYWIAFCIGHLFPRVSMKVCPRCGCKMHPNVFGPNIWFLFPSPSVSCSVWIIHPANTKHYTLTNGICFHSYITQSLILFLTRCETFCYPDKRLK